MGPGILESICHTASAVVGKENLGLPGKNFLMFSPF